MLSLKPDDLHEEIMRAKQVRDDHLTHFEEQVKRKAGVAYRKGGWEEFPENQYFEFEALILPHCAFQNPKVRVSSRRSENLYEILSSAFMYALNRWIKDEKFVEEHRLAVADMFLNWGVVLMTRDQGWPTISRLNQKHWAFDAFAEKYDDARLAFHEHVMDKDDLVRTAMAAPQAGWDLAAIQSLSEDNNIGQFYGTDEKGSVNGSETLPKRKAVVLRSVWIRDDILGPDPDDPDAFHGVIVTLAADGSSPGKIIRQPQRFFGPYCGPYHLFSAYTSQNDGYPLGPMTANWALIEELNKGAVALNKQARSFKRIVFVSSSSPDLANKIASSPNDWIIPVEGLERDAVVPLEIGGLAPQLVEHFTMLRERTDRGTGITDAKRGIVNGSATATENAIASSASDSRVGYLRQKVYETAQTLLESASFYIFHDPDFKVTLGQEFAEYMIQQGMDPSNTTFVGGELRQLGLKFPDLQLEIEPYSMERVDTPSMQQKVMALTQFTLQAAPIMPTAPFIDWRTLFAIVGNAFNMSEFKKIIDMNQLRQMGVPLTPGSPSEAHSSTETSAPVGYENQASYANGETNAGVSVSRQNGGGMGGVFSGGQSAVRKTNSPGGQGVYATPKPA